jgi:pimeloyl-ACP methyl ester carboxylesterase
MTSSTVVLLHGLAASPGSTWREAGWLDLLADAGRRVLTPELPGHDSRTLVPGEPVDPVGDLLAALPDDGEPVAAIGFSMGARTILGAAIEAPHRFERIVLSGIGERLLVPDDAGRSIAEAIESGDDAHPIGRYFLDHAARSGTDPAAVAAMLRHEWEPLTPERMARASMPALVVVGDQDLAAGDPAPLAAALPNARAVVLKRLDHFATPKDFGFLDAALGFVGAA